MIFKASPPKLNVFEGVQITTSTRHDVLCTLLPIDLGPADFKFSVGWGVGEFLICHVIAAVILPMLCETLENCVGPACKISNQMSSVDLAGKQSPNPFLQRKHRPSRQGSGGDVREWLSKEEDDWQHHVPSFHVGWNILGTALTIWCYSSPTLLDICEEVCSSTHMLHNMVIGFMLFCMSFCLFATFLRGS